ncbi:hypothetical protein ACFPRL_36295 [Pseudoclavibacter helvolus]
MLKPLMNIISPSLTTSLSPTLLRGPNLPRLQTNLAITCSRARMA